jgi:phosphopantothenoylcysteine decarboxylase/phosphopantothenate--cysteine ligase
MTIPILKDRRILLGITGSIAAYKAVDLASKLAQAGAQVDVIMSEAGQRFVTGLTFQSVTGRRAFTDDDLWGGEAHVLHIGLAEGPDLLVNGRADSLLTITALAARCPLLIAPAMDAGMFEHPATQANLATLRERGTIVVGPVEGRMASGLVGMGRMVEPTELFGRIRLALGRKGPLVGQVVVVTAGGTQEPIDPVRVVANHSSGKQGFAMAQSSLDRGARVILITGPVCIPAPVGVERVDVGTAAEMRDAVLSVVDSADALLMVAAVADFRPTTAAQDKIKRRRGVPEVVLEPTDDILELVAKQRKKTGHPTVVVGFAAESQDLVENARTKLKEKSLSLIVANDITDTKAGFAVDTNQVTLLDEAGNCEELPLMSKVEVAELILDRVVELLDVED